MNQIIENALVVGILLCVFIIPVVLNTLRNRKKRRESRAALLQNAVNTHQLTLDRSAEIGGQIMGWDTSKKTLVIITDNEPQVTSLPAAARCNVFKTYQSTSVQSILMQFSDTQNRMIYSLPLYRQYTDNEMQLKSIEEQARQWEAWLNDRLS